MATMSGGGWASGPTSSGERCSYQWAMSSRMRLADGFGHVGGGIAVAGGEGDLDAVGDAAGLGPHERALAHEACGRAGAVEEIGVGGERW